MQLQTSISWVTYMKKYKNYIFKKYNSGRTKWDPTWLYFSYVYQLKDGQSYQVNNANGENVATFLGHRETIAINT